MHSFRRFVCERGHTPSYGDSLLTPNDFDVDFAGVGLTAERDLAHWRRSSSEEDGIRSHDRAVAGERSHCRYANLSSYFVIPNLTPPAA